MNVAPAQKVSDAAMLIPDEQYLGVLEEIMGCIRDDRKQVSDYIDNMADMVMNDGDPTTATKEALVNLVKIKTDLQDKMLKAAELMTRLKMKNTYAYSGAHMNAIQQNNLNIGADAQDFSRRELIRAINHAKKKQKE
jgi:type I restriction-modification system DNA methylase subunit